MQQMLTRLPVVLDPSIGVFGAEHFQMAYATNDIDQACAFFADQLGIREFRRLEGQLPAGGHIRVELAWVGTIMYELLTASGAGSELYVGRLPAGAGFALRHHHLGYLIHDQAEWSGLLDNAARRGFAVPHSRNSPGFMQACFVDVPPLGHYLEYILPEAAGLEFFNNVPRH
jgi:catechol 2,3-dioxygenase-like lactoylglutathione lyase family enzyme